MIFRISKPNSSSDPSYLFGTIHAKSNKAYHFYHSAKLKIEQTQIFAAEIDLDDPYAQQSSLFFRLPSEKPLPYWMNSTQYQRVRKQLYKSFGVDIHQYRFFQPTFILSNLSVDILENTFQHALDYQLYLDAKALDKQIAGLESFGDQFKLIEKLDFNVQVRQLKQVASNPAHFRKKVLHQENVYSSNDIRRLYHLGRNALGQFRRVLLKERNIKMTNRFIDLMNDKSTFAAAGASHLGGQFGLLSLLKSRGYKLQEIT